MADFELGPRLGAINLKGSQCILWQGAMRNGYGVKKIPGRGDNSTINAHRYVYEKTTGKKIPPGMAIDHTCRNRRCINPKHMEIVSYSENKSRAWKAQRKEYKHKNYKGETVSKGYGEKAKEELRQHPVATPAAAVGGAVMAGGVSNRLPGIYNWQSKKRGQRALDRHNDEIERVKRKTGTQDIGIGRSGKYKPLSEFSDKPRKVRTVRDKSRWENEKAYRGRTMMAEARNKPAAEQRRMRAEAQRLMQESRQENTDYINRRAKKWNQKKWEKWNRPAPGSTSNKPDSKYYEKRTKKTAKWYADRKHKWHPKFVEVKGQKRTISESRRTQAAKHMNATTQSLIRRATHTPIRPKTKASWGLTTVPVVAGGGLLAAGAIGRGDKIKKYDRGDGAATTAGAMGSAAAYTVIPNKLESNKRPDWEKKTRKNPRLKRIAHDHQVKYGVKYYKGDASKTIPDMNSKKWQFIDVGDRRWIEYNRHLPSELPGSKIRRLQGYTHAGKTGIAAAGAVAAGGGYGAHKLYQKSRRKK